MADLPTIVHNIIKSHMKNLRRDHDNNITYIFNVVTSMWFCISDENLHKFLQHNIINVLYNTYNQQYNSKTKLFDLNDYLGKIQNTDIFNTSQYYPIINNKVVDLVTTKLDYCRREHGCLFKTEFSLVNELFANNFMSYLVLHNKESLKLLKLLCGYLLTRVCRNDGKIVLFTGNDVFTIIIRQIINKIVINNTSKKILYSAEEFKIDINDSNKLKNETIVFTFNKFQNSDNTPFLRLQSQSYKKI